MARRDGWPAHAGDPRAVKFPPRPEGMIEFDCFRCLKGKHKSCDKFGSLWCMCRREFHEETF